MEIYHSFLSPYEYVFEDGEQRFPYLYSSKIPLQKNVVLFLFLRKAPEDAEQQGSPLSSLAAQPCSFRLECAGWVLMSSFLFFCFLLAFTSLPSSLDYLFPLSGLIWGLALGTGFPCNLASTVETGVGNFL